LSGDTLSEVARSDKAYTDNRFAGPVSIESRFVFIPSSENEGDVFLIDGKTAEELEVVTFEQFSDMESLNAEKASFDSKRNQIFFSPESASDIGIVDYNPFYQ